MPLSLYMPVRMVLLIVDGDSLLVAFLHRLALPSEWYGGGNLVCVGLTRERLLPGFRILVLLALTRWPFPDLSLGYS
jgi:hypothetical protein